MRTKAKIALFCAAVLLTAAVIFGSAYAVSKAKGEKARYIEAERRLALADFCAAVQDMENALSAGDRAALSFAAGRAEAYLSRAGVTESGEAYRILRLIASEKYGAEECRALAAAAKKALSGDDKAFLSLASIEVREFEITEETTEDIRAAEMLERIGKGRDDVALARAAAFACPNAVFKEAVCDDGCFKYSGDNIFIAVGGSNSRVLMYCFERDVDPRYSVSREEAVETAENLIRREKLKLSASAHTELRDGVYRSVWYKEDSTEKLVVLEIYSDTGRLRLYDAVNYYKNLS